ncbi:serine/threonine-protein kinase [Actinoplanes sp. M2I2]|uniref:serine/threonine-protein kinase n=1 Tax=Actinoplanes sp. M2I2 TaxID=1734444 RepID=UPI0020218496|nr:serine/threonine-protein kinase [Actinoplanes sp. M2I2]
MTDPLRPGDPAELGGYRLLGRLGQGGMGAVYLGRGADGRLVAVKMIRPEYAHDTEFRARFRSEVNRARQVPPFCTAEVLDADPDHPTPYLVVEYVDGPSLADVIAEHGPLGGGSLHSVAVGVATALAAIHGASVIHRDLKPSNVLLAPGTPKVIDFGIARAFEATSQHTRTDQMVGTVAYMAPERFDTEHYGEVGPAADVFAWGAVITYAGTGRTPFRADSPTATAARILTQPPDLSGLPDPLQSVVARTLAKDPAERPTAHELLALLLDLDAGRPTELIRPDLLRAATAAQRAPVAHRGARAGRVRRAGVAVLALGVAGLLTAQALPRLGAASNAQTGAAPSAGRAGPPASPMVSWQRAPGGLAIIDRLDRPGQWQDTRNDAEGRCVFEDERLEARTGMASVYRCHGPRDSFAKDQAISVGAAILTPGACAAIWFRATGPSAYLVSFCEKEVRLGVDTAEGVTDEVRAAVDTGLGLARRIDVVVRGERATVTVDGSELLTARLGRPSLAAGQVTFGVLDDIISGDARAAFARAEVVKL